MWQLAAELSLLAPCPENVQAAPDPGDYGHILGSQGQLARLGVDGVRLSESHRRKRTVRCPSWAELVCVGGRG